MRRSSWVGITLAVALAFLTAISDDRFVAQRVAAAEGEADKTALAVEALSRLQNVNLDEKPQIKAAVLRVLEKTRGTASFVKLVQQFKLTGQNDGLLEVAIRNSTNDTGVEAMRLVLATKELSAVQVTLDGTNFGAAARIIEALANAKDRQTTGLLLPLVTDAKRDPGLRKQSVRALAQTPDGAAALVKLAEADQLASDVKFTAATELNHARWPEIKAAAARWLPLPQGQNSQPLPPIAELVKLKADALNGAKVFADPAKTCVTCHQVNGLGVDFGPNLSTIGAKLGKDALFEAILDPNAGISFGFEAWQLTLKSGDEAFGLIVSDSADELAVKAVGGIITRYKKSEVARREQTKLSVMPVGLQANLTTQELVDLVEYLASLKQPAAP